MKNFSCLETNTFYITNGIAKQYHLQISAIYGEMEVICIELLSYEKWHKTWLLLTMLIKVSFLLKAHFSSSLANTIMVLDAALSSIDAVQHDRLLCFI